MVKTSKIVFVLIILGILVFTGCGTETKKILGEWEGYDVANVLEFTKSDKLYWDGRVCTYEFEDGELLVDNSLFISAFDYSVEDNSLVLTDVGDKSTMTFVRIGQLLKDEAEMKKLEGEWGVLTPLYTFTDEATLIVKNLTTMSEMDEGSYIASNGIIRYEPETDFYHHMYLEYEFKGDKLMLRFAGAEEPMELVKINTSKVEEVEEAEKAEEAEEAEEKAEDYVASLGMDKIKMLNLYGQPSEVIDYQGSMAYKYEENMITYFVNIIDEKEVITAFYYYGEEAILSIKKNMTSDEVMNVLGKPKSMGYDEMTEEYFLNYYIDDFYMGIRLSNGEDGIVDLINVKSVADSEVLIEADEVDGSYYLDLLGKPVVELIEQFGEPLSQETVEDQEDAMFYGYEDFVYKIITVNEKEIIERIYYWGEDSIFNIYLGMTKDEVTNILGVPYSDKANSRTSYIVEDYYFSVGLVDDQNSIVDMIAITDMNVNSN